MNYMSDDIHTSHFLMVEGSAESKEEHTLNERFLCFLNERFGIGRLGEFKQKKKKEEWFQGYLSNLKAHGQIL